VALMSEVLIWPADLLVPENTDADVVPFNTSSGRMIGGAKPSYNKGDGFWKIELQNIVLMSPEQRRTWDAISVHLKGSAGRIAVPIWSMDSAPYPNSDCGWEDESHITHSDGSGFSDGTTYLQSPISIVAHGVAGAGLTVMKMRLINAGADITGSRFSYRHAAYKIGQVVEIVDDVWTVYITPPIAMTIPDGADLEFHRPTCIAKLENDTGMKRGMKANGFESLSVTFLEDVEYWVELAAAG
jgi:hypothetical protein